VLIPPHELIGNCHLQDKSQEISIWFSLSAHQDKKMTVVQQGRNNAPVLAIKIHLCKIAAKPRPPGVETPGYYLSSLKGLKVLYLKDLL